MINLGFNFFFPSLRESMKANELGYGRLDVNLPVSSCYPSTGLPFVALILQFFKFSRTLYGWPKTQMQQLPVLANLVRSLEAIKLEA